MPESPEVTLFTESLRHMKAMEFDDIGDIWRHEGFKKGVEGIFNLASDQWLGRLILERFAGGTTTIFDSSLATNVGKLPLDGPTGIAAGWDKTGKSVLAWQWLGANHITIGGVTYFPQEGNPMPRLRTFDSRVGDHGVSRSLNSYGFPSPGANKVAYNIAEQIETGLVNIPIIVQVTLNKEFYEENNRHMIPGMVAKTIRTLRTVADAYNLGLSSPNTMGMRDAQARDFLLEVILEAKEAADGRQITLKGDGDGGTSRLDMYGSLATETEIALELINTTRLKRIIEKYGIDENMPGGLAGADPDYQQLAIDSVRYVYEEFGDRVPIIGMGGINSSEQNIKMLRAGASATGVNTVVRQLGGKTFGALEGGVSQEIDKLIGPQSLSRVIGADTKRGARAA